MRPHVHVNCAMTLDGHVGGPGRTPLRISDDEDIRRVHALRAASDAILVGVGTVLADDPKLTVKWELLGRTGRPPLRVVLDPKLRTPHSALVRDSQAPTLFFAAADAPSGEGDVERVPQTAGDLDLGVVLERLSKRGVKNLLVEGGPRTLRRFFEDDWVDEFTLYVAPRVLARADASKLFDGPFDLSKHLRLEKASTMGEGSVLTWRRVVR